MKSDATQAHRHSIRHRDEILASETCGCFYCRRTFPPSAIVEWCETRAGVGHTACCPHCGVDSVVGSASGYPVTPEFLEKMHARWFGD